MIRQDFLDIRRAIREGWNISAELYDSLPQQAVAMLQDQNPRNRLAAMRLLNDMKKSNDEKLLRLLDKMAPDLQEVTHNVEQQPTTVRIIEVDDYYGSAGAAERAGGRAAIAGPDAPATGDSVEPGAD